MISKFLLNKLIDYIENYLINHSSEIQALLLAELSKIAQKVIDYIEEKLKEFETHE